MSISIYVNGIKYHLTKEITIQQLLTFLNINVSSVIIEYNKVIIRRKFWSHFLVQEEGKLEIVTIVGGG